MTPIPVYILAGGHSSRFGSDKALADVDGRPMIVRVAEQWMPAASRIVAVADRAGKYDSCGLTTIADQQAGIGPIGGLLTALLDCGSGWLMLAACDALILDADFPQRMLLSISEKVQVTALKGPKWEPMPAVYHCSMLPVVQASVALGERALWRIIEQVPHTAIAYQKEQPPIMQMNTREELQRFLTIRRR